MWCFFHEWLFSRYRTVGSEKNQCLWEKNPRTFFIFSFVFLPSTSGLKAEMSRDKIIQGRKLQIFFFLFTSTHVDLGRVIGRDYFPEEIII
jgi:hypothetical protein